MPRARAPRAAVDLRADGGMHGFVPAMRFLRVAALTVAVGTVAGLSLLALVYLTSAVEGEAIRLSNARQRAVDAGINSALGGASRA